MGQTVVHSKVLVRFLLRENNLGIWPNQTGSKLLAKALSTNTVLDYVDISNNLLCNADMRHIAPAVHGTHVKGGLMTINVCHSNLSQEIVADLKTSFSEHIVL